MNNITSIEKRTADEWRVRIRELEVQVVGSERRVEDIETSTRRLQSMAREGDLEAEQELERQKADLIAAIADRDGLQASLIAAGPTGECSSGR
jgi:hypothetical protein